MKEKDTPAEVLESFMQSDLDIKELKRNIKKKELITLLVKIKSLYDEQRSLFKEVEHQLHEILKTITGLKKKESEEREKQESFINEKVLRKSLDILEKDKKIVKEILAIGEHYKVDIYKLIWKKLFIKKFYILLSKKMKKTGYHDFKLNWDRINILIKHQGKPIEESNGEISPKKLKQIISLVDQALK